MAMAKVGAGAMAARLLLQLFTHFALVLLLHGPPHVHVAGLRLACVTQHDGVPQQQNRGQDQSQCQDGYECTTGWAGYL